MPSAVSCKIIVTGHAPWLEFLRSSLSKDSKIYHYHTKHRYISCLTDDLASIILVDGNVPDWQFWTVTPKASSATRRIPIVLVRDTTMDQETAQIYGADLWVTTQILLDQLPQIIVQYSRVPTSQQIQDLELACRDSLPTLAQQGLIAFNHGEFYRQHDLFEALWMETQGPVRNLYKAILQVGIAYYHIESGNYRGAYKMLQRSVQWLESLPSSCQGIDLDQFRIDAYAVRDHLACVMRGDIQQFDHAYLKPIKRINE